MEDEYSTKPVVVFDYADNSGSPLRERLIQQSKDCLAVAQLPQYDLVQDLRSLFKARGADTKIAPVWKTCSKYVQIVPLSFDDMVEVLGMDRARSMISSPVDWKRIDKVMGFLKHVQSDPDYIKCFWGDITDAIEAGNNNDTYYRVTCHFWRYVYNGLEAQLLESPKKVSKELVVRNSVPS